MQVVGICSRPTPDVRASDKFRQKLALAATACSHVWQRRGLTGAQPMLSEHSTFGTQERGNGLMLISASPAKL